MGQTYSQWGPGETSVAIRRLIMITCGISIFSAFANSLFVQVLGLKGPQELLSLSWHGLQNYFLWQPITYLFIQNSSSQGINLSFLLSLAVNMYVLWVLGSTLLERIGTKHFLGLYFIGGILAGLLTVFTMPLTGHYMPLAGPTASLLAVFVVWTMSNPQSELMLFFLIPIKTKWLLAGILGAICLISLSQLDFISLTFYLSATLIGYLYGLLVFNMQSPFKITHGFDRAVSDVRDDLLKKIRTKKKADRGVDLGAETAGKPQSKVYDFKSGEAILDDDAFVDLMLTKISKNGEKSLSVEERRRMQQISATRRGKE